MHVSVPAPDASSRVASAPQDLTGCVTDASGRPLRLFHGSHGGAVITAFSAAHSQMDPGERGIYFTDCPRHASEYASGWGDEGPDYGGVVYPVYLRMSNPYIVTSEEWGRGHGMSPEQARAHGHDGYVIRGQEGGNTYIVFDGGRVLFTIGAGELLQVQAEVHEAEETDETNTIR